MRQIARTYDDGQPVHALHPTDLHVAAGDHVSITGPSGSGKSTLLNLFGLLDAPSTGSYQVGGVDTVTCKPAMRTAIRGQVFGFVFQSFHLLPGRTALENVEIGLLYGPHRRRKRRQMATEALERMGLTHRMQADPRQLSGGEMQRVAIVRAVVARPQVLFCDEPTGNLDSANTQVVLAQLRQLNLDGLTVVVVTHDATVADTAGRRLQVADGVVREI
ncbi:ABC transporter ATP-binding protein [Actinoplanes sp. NPDC026619]|uniref:ABC transporter ATP-binding protein n=1 Tax=Actinoplanes sp. NPDC026619 TaxID=3155798 RepID=UPI0033FFFD04